MGGRDLEPDRFYYERALQLIGRERGSAPLFLFVYLTANHFPWNYPFRGELTPDWRGPGNAPEIDEYIRRQMMSAHDYAEFLAHLKQDFPGEPFLIVRFGDHQPWLSADVLEPNRSDEAIAKKLGKSESPWDLLTNTAIADDDPEVRRSAVEAGMHAFEGNEALRQGVMGPANTMSDAEMAAFARANMYHRAEDFVRNLQPYPEPEKTRFWRRLRRLARVRRRPQFV